MFCEVIIKKKINQKKIGEVGFLFNFFLYIFTITKKKQKTTKHFYLGRKVFASCFITKTTEEECINKIIQKKIFFFIFPFLFVKI